VQVNFFFFQIKEHGTLLCMETNLKYDKICNSMQDKLNVRHATQVFLIKIFINQNDINNVTFYVPDQNRYLFKK
jgi:hypothetical protein